MNELPDEALVAEIRDAYATSAHGWAAGDAQLLPFRDGVFGLER